MDERFMEAAAANEQLHRDVALAQAMAPHLDADAAIFDGVHCVEDDCDMEIPMGRLALGKIRCVSCQARRERRRG